MGNAPLLHQEILGACIKATSLQYSCGFGNLPGRKRGNLEEPDPPLHDNPPSGRLFGSLGVRVWVVADPQGMLPSMSEWMTSTNCASPGSNLSSGGLPLNKGPAGSRPGRKTESAWQPHAVSHLQPGFGSLPTKMAHRLRGILGWASTHIPLLLCQAPFHSPV